MGINDHNPGNPVDSERAKIDPAMERRQPAAPAKRTGGGIGIVGAVVLLAAVVALIAMAVYS
jgi:hypothetical protein